jgi:hypothetical protein
MQAHHGIVSAAGGGAPLSVGLRGLESAVKLHKGRIKESTIKGYQSHLKTMCIYIVSLMDSNDCVCEGRKDLVSVEGQGDSMQLQLVVPVPDTVLASFFGHIHTDKYLRDMQISSRVAHLHRPKVLQKNANTNICSASFFRGYKSALKWWYTEKGADLGDNIDSIISGVTAGQQRNVAAAKQSGDMDAIEGRLPLSATGYRVVCLALSKLSDFNMSLFAWPFLVWSWNLMVRPISVGHLKFSDISWVVTWLLELNNISNEQAAHPALTVADVAQMERATADDVFETAFHKATEALSYTYSSARLCEVQLASFYKRMIRCRNENE